MQFFALALVIPPGGVSFAWYGLYKNEKKIWQVNVVYHCGNSDQMALPSVDFLNPLPLCLFELIFKLVEIPSSLSYAPINKKGVRCKDAEMRDIR